MEPFSLEYYSTLGLSLAIGLLIGLERGWRQRALAEGSRIAGLRTFGLFGLLGGLAGILGQEAQPLVAAALVAGAVVVSVGSHLRTTNGNGNVSITNTIAALLTVALGVLATVHPGPALAAAALVTFVLAARQQLHGWVRGLTEADVLAVARFAIIAGAILPLLPDARYGPYGAFNPRELWLVVVVVCGISFAAYAANRRFGATRGTLATAAIGGLYSSTAVTAALARRLSLGQLPSRLAGAGIAIASATLFLRVLVLTGLLTPFALPRLALIIGPAALVALGLALVLLRTSRGTEPAATDAGSMALTGSNPFELRIALAFAALMALLSLVVHWAEAEYGDAGIATLLAITGAMDVDAAIVAMRALPPGTVKPQLAGMILSLPLLLNTLVKSGIVIAVAGWRKGLPAAAPMLIAAAVIPLGLWASL